MAFSAVAVGFVDFMMSCHIKESRGATVKWQRGIFRSCTIEVVASEIMLNMLIEQVIEITKF